MTSPSENTQATPHPTPLLGEATSLDSTQDGSTPRRCGSQLNGPFGFGPEDDDECITAFLGDVEMEDVSGDPSAIVNAHAVPILNRYAGTTMADRLVFMHAYDTYLRQLSALNTHHLRLLVRPVSANLDYRVRCRVAQYDMEKVPDDVTESEWIAYLAKAKQEDYRGITVLDRTMARRKMDVHLLDAISRVDGLCIDFMNVLKAHNMAVLIRAEPKRVVTFLTWH